MQKCVLLSYNLLGICTVEAHFLRIKSLHQVLQREICSEVSSEIISYL